MTVPQTDSGRRFVWPADYYSSATPAPVLPRGVSYGCGLASAVVLLLIFVGGALMSSGGFTNFVDFAIGMSLGEMRKQYTSDVTAEQRKAFEDEALRLRENLRGGRVGLPAMQPFLQGISNASADRKVTAEEVRTLEQSARMINKTAKAK
ncbi:MAG TPA: hypothetical protein VEK11_19920 [Thermoanaerobaculia bacterium]|jgi:hypothetical protein|nr:hypothetical protein [Thermoanaerobaculia bacterium]